MLRRLLWVSAGFALCSIGPSLPAGVTGGEKPAAAPTGQHRARLVAQVGHAGWVSAVAFSPDGRLVLSGSFDRTVRLWETASGKELRRLEGHTDLVNAAVFSPDGKYVLTGSHDRTARLWDAATGNPLRRFEGHDAFVGAVAFSPDGKYVLTGSFDHTARLWETATSKELRRFQGHTGVVGAVAFSPDGKHVLTGSHDRTARLWETASGKEVRRFEGHTDWVISVIFTADGRHVFTGSADRTARLWETATGRELRRYRGHTERIWSMALSPDGRQLLTGSGDDTARLWETATGKELHRLGHSREVLAVAFSPDGKQALTGGKDETPRLWETATGRELRRFQGQSSTVHAVAFSADGKYVLTGRAAGDRSARIWDLASGRELRRFQGHTQSVTSVAFSADGRQVLTGSEDQTARLWDAASGNPLRRFEGHKGQVRSVAFSRDGRQILTGGYDGTARLWDAASGKELQRFEAHWVNAVAFSADGKQVFTGGNDKTARLWDAATGKELRTLRGHTEPVRAVAFSADGRQVLTASNDRTARLWDAASGKELRRFTGHTGNVNAVAFSPDGKRVLTGSYDRTARLWETASAREVQRFQGHTNSITSVAFSGDGKVVLTGSWDRSARLWEAAGGRELCRLVGFDNGDWAVIDPDGRFDASNGGNVEGLHWVAADEPIALSQLKERYYDPGLLAKYLGFNDEPVRDVAAFRAVRLFPGAQAEPPAVGSTKLTVKLRNQGGGLGKVQVFVNGRELLADARGPKFDADAGAATLSVDLAGAAVVAGKTNVVRVVTWNAEDYLSSRGLDLTFVPVGRPDEQPPELYAIVAGVSTYAGEQLKLRFAAKDAHDMAAALRAGGARLFGADRAHVSLLCDGDDKALAPTRANLEKAFAAARKSRPGDVLIVYLAGHGVALQDHGQEIYCYLTREARTVDRATFHDPEVRRRGSVTSAELTEWIKRIPALKQVLVLDTCAAGAAAAKLIEHRDVGADQIRAIDRLRDRTGFHVLMGCAADRVSYEATQFSQGLLTYALLQAMRGARLREGQYVDVSQWFQYAADEVPQLARHVGGIQKPLVMAPRGTSFDVARLLAEDRKAIPLAPVRPLLLRPVLQNADENVLDDDLGLMPLLRAKLREASYAGSRGSGKALPPVYVDADEMPGAVRPSGKYTVAGKIVRVRLNLRRDGRTLAVVEVEGTRDDVAGLAARLAAVVEERLNNL